MTLNEVNPAAISAQAIGGWGKELGPGPGTLLTLGQSAAAGSPGEPGANAAACGDAPGLASPTHKKVRSDGQ